MFPLDPTRRVRAPRPWHFRPSLLELDGRVLPGFLAPLTFGNGGSDFPNSVAVGDFDRDGTPDLAVANVINNVSVLLGNGNGSFGPATGYHAGDSPQSLTVGDLRGDGILDLVVANSGLNQSSQGSVSVLLGNGDGSFEPAVNYVAGSHPFAVAVGDLNGDGIPDLAVANIGSFGSTPSVGILLGNGDGSFQAAVNYAAGLAPWSVAVGDFDGDGISDLVVTNPYSNAVSVLLGNGDGSLQPPVNYVVGSQPRSVAVGDFDGDGVLDLAVANSADQQADIPSVSVLLGNGDGTFHTTANYAFENGSYSVAAGDFNGDGVLDLAVTNLLYPETDSNTVSVLLGNGDGTFQPSLTYAAGHTPIALAVGDFNADGSPDRVVTNHQDRAVSILLNDGAWTDRPGASRRGDPAAGQPPEPAAPAAPSLAAHEELPLNPVALPPAPPAPVSVAPEQYPSGVPVFSPPPAPGTRQPLGGAEAPAWARGAAWPEGARVGLLDRLFAGPISGGLENGFPDTPSLPGWRTCPRWRPGGPARAPARRPQ
jgi:hypothetical protein